MSDLEQVNQTTTEEKVKMEQYIGTKVLFAAPMNRLDYNNLRGWTLPENEDGNDAGYLVEYTDGGAPNHPNFDGYISWSPKAIFEGSYKRSNQLPYSMALESLKLGLSVSRAIWDNGEDTGRTYVSLVQLPEIQQVNGDVAQGTAIILMFDHGHAFHFVPSDLDQLATDWYIIR